MTSSRLGKSGKPRFPHVQHFQPLRGTGLPWTWSADPGRRGPGRRGGVVLRVPWSKIAGGGSRIGRDLPSPGWPIFGPEARPRAFSRRNRADAGFAPAVPGDHEGHRANFSSADLTGRDFSGADLRGAKMDRAVLRGADFTGANLQSANPIGAFLQDAGFDLADLSRARLSGGNLVSASFENAHLAKADMEFA
jgi:Pentapeptide repeats (8 copies)